MRQSRALFDLGQIVATKQIADSLDPAEIQSMIRNHVTGDHGILCNEDIDANREAIDQGERIFSAYMVNGGSKVYVITERDRSLTSVMFADEYRSRS